MDKKNTMLLTVIAVATLLVAVVGATFAYFAITPANSNATTQTNAETAKIPVITLNGKISSLNMYLTAADMVEGDDAIPYYATTAAIAGTTSVKSSTKMNHNIAELTAKGGNDGDTYDCNLTITITRGGTMTLTSGDAKIYLSGLGVENSIDSSAATSGIDLSTISDTKTITINNLNINANSDTKTLVADVEVNNTKVDQTTNMAGKTLSVQIATNLSSCKLHTVGE